MSVRHGFVQYRRGCPALRSDATGNRRWEWCWKCASASLLAIAMTILNRGGRDSLRILDAHENIVTGDNGELVAHGPLNDPRKMDLINNSVGIDLAGQIMSTVNRQGGSVRGMAAETARDYLDRKDVQRAIVAAVNDAIASGSAVWIDDSVGPQYTNHYPGAGR
jgi:hypothetical protein